MAQDLLDTNKKRCYACIQWEGIRIFYSSTKKIKTDAGSLGTCRLNKLKKKGRDTCKHFEPLR